VGRYTAGVGMIVVHVEVSLSENVPNVMIDCSTSWQSDEKYGLDAAYNKQGQKK
jgi:hypothetical protein